MQGERSQQSHHVVVVLFGCSEAANDPVEQVGIGTLEQSLETVELCAVEVCDMGDATTAENDVALLRPAVPAPEQQPPASDISII